MSCPDLEVTTRIHPRRLFWIGVLALFAVAVNTVLRAGIAARLMTQWLVPIDPVHAGEMIGAALGASFFGDSLTLFIASPFLDVIGMRRMLLGAAVSLTAGILLVANAGFLAEGRGIFHLVLVGMALCGIGCGAVGATVNPLVAALYPGDKVNRLNRLHAWSPVGIIIGGLACALLGVGDWRLLFGLGILPVLVFGVFAAGARFPSTERAALGVSMKDMFGEILRRPGFLLWFGAMFLTAASELAPGQWVDVALSHRVGMRGILLLVYASGLMFVMRHFAGVLARRVGNVGLLWGSSLLAGIGLLLLSRAEGPVGALLAATVWGCGVCFMWPTMMASVAERYPRGGAWMIGLMGMAGVLSSYLVLPRLGQVYDHAKIGLAGGADALSQLSGEALAGIEDQAASISFATLAVLPAILLILFGGLWFKERRVSA